MNAPRVNAAGCEVKVVSEVTTNPWLYRRSGIRAIVKRQHQA